MFALVDAVGFYASAEKVFDPSIRFKPVVVLTNNDGCICAICPIARKLNIPKFQPYFKVQNYLKQHNVVVRSSNYELYADLSERMMTVINRFCDDHYVYSIDESFLRFTGFTKIIDDWADYGQTIRRAVWRETGLPVGVGFGTTPTLAKAVSDVINDIFKVNTRFYRCGIGAIELESELFQQADMFSVSADKPRMMECLDAINKRYGVGTLSIGSEKLTQTWNMKRAFLSPHYTTRWSDIPIIKCN